MHCQRTTSPNDNSPTTGDHRNQPPYHRRLTPNLTGIRTRVSFFVILMILVDIIGEKRVIKLLNRF
ncbi:hypothetical protein Hanom_Chr04g00368051 [Helianthus anomalus]